MDMERSLCKGFSLIPSLSGALPFLQGPQSSSWQWERPLSGQRAFTDHSPDQYWCKLYFQGELDALIPHSQGAQPVEVIAGGSPWKWKAQIRIWICKDFVVDWGRTGWSVCISTSVRKQQIAAAETKVQKIHLNTTGSFCFLNFLICKMGIMTATIRFWWGLSEIIHRKCFVPHQCS